MPITNKPENILYYGAGSCDISGSNIFAIQINYTGAMAITKTSDENTILATRNNKIIIMNMFETTRPLSSLFTYKGIFTITSAMICDSEGKLLDLKIELSSDYSQNIKTKSEDLTIKSEKINASPRHGKRPSITTMDVKFINNLSTEVAPEDILYTINGERYHGAYHIHLYDASDKTEDLFSVMSGSVHTEDAVDLFILNKYDLILEKPGKAVKRGERLTRNEATQRRRKSFNKMIEALPNQDTKKSPAGSSPSRPLSEKTMK